jgi:hypothetical protein
MVFKWVLIAFAVAATALFVLSKTLAFLNPPKPGRPKAALLQRVDRALRWMVLLPLAIAVCLLAFALW